MFAASLTSSTVTCAITMVHLLNNTWIRFQQKPTWCTFAFSQWKLITNYSKNTILHSIPFCPKGLIVWCTKKLSLALHDFYLKKQHWWPLTSLLSFKFLQIILKIVYSSTLLRISDKFAGVRLPSSSFFPFFSRQELQLPLSSTPLVPAEVSEITLSGSGIIYMITQFSICFRINVIRLSNLKIFSKYSPSHLSTLLLDIVSLFHCSTSSTTVLKY